MAKDERNKKMCRSSYALYLTACTYDATSASFPISCTIAFMAIFVARAHCDQHMVYAGA